MVALLSLFCGWQTQGSFHSDTVSHGSDARPCLHSFAYWWIFELEWTPAPPLSAVFLFAAILGVHTLVTSRETYDGSSAKEGYNSKSAWAGWNDSRLMWIWRPEFRLCLFVDVIKGEKMVPVFDEPPNPTNVEETLQRIKSNDSSLTEVNINNIKVHKSPRSTHTAVTTNTCPPQRELHLLCGNFNHCSPPPEHSNSHSKGHCKSHGEEHTCEKVQHGSNAE